MATSRPPDSSGGIPAQPPQQPPRPQGAAPGPLPDKDHPVFPDYASI